jgi:glycerol kinase
MIGSCSFRRTYSIGRCCGAKRPELSGLGAAFAARLGCGFWSSTAEISKAVASHDAFKPALEEEMEYQRLRGYIRVTARSH